MSERTVFGVARGFGSTGFLALCLSLASPCFAAINHSGNISANETWTKADVHVLTGDVRVLPGVTLTIRPGVVVKAQVNRGLFVDGTLIAVGLSDTTIYFTSYQDDVGGDTNGDGSGSTPVPGDWEQIRFSSTAGASVLDHCVIRYGGIAGCCPDTRAMVEVIGSSPSFANCIFSNSYIQALSLSSGCASTFSNCSFVSNQNFPILQTLDCDPTFAATTVAGNLQGNGIQLNGGTLTVNRTWKNMGLTYVVTNDVTVGVGVTLTIQPGVSVKFTSNRGLFVDGTLVALASSGQPIYFSSFRDDLTGHDTNGDGSATSPAAGDWEQIRFSSTAGGSALDWCVIRYGGIAGCCPDTRAMVEVNGSSPSFAHTTFSNAYVQALSLASGSASAFNVCSFVANQTYPILQTLDCDPSFVAATVAGNLNGNGIQLNGGTLNANHTWKNMGLTYIVTNDVTVGVGVTLTVQPGVTVKFASNRSLFVDGTLNAVATSGQRIYFSSIRDDATGHDTNGDGSATSAAPGDWSQMRFSSTAGASTLEWCTIRYGGIRGCCPDTRPMVEVIGSSPTFTNGVFSNAYVQALSLSSGAASTVGYCSFLSNANYPIVQTLDCNPTFTSTTVSGNVNGNGIQINGGTLTANRTWKNMGLTYIVTNDVRVGVGVTLTVQAGVSVKFTSNRALFVDGALVAIGANGQLIYFSSIKDDATGHDTNGDGSATSPAPGDWNQIRFDSTAGGSSLDYCVVRYGGIRGCCPDTRPMVEIVGSSPTIDHSTFSNGYTTLILTSGASPVIHGSSILTSTTIFGLQNLTTSVTVDARLNWWGNSSGPLDASTGPPLYNPGGTGSKVSDYVDYSNWQAAAPPANSDAMVSPTSITAVGYGSSSVLRQVVLQNSGSGPLVYSVVEAGLVSPPPGDSTRTAPDFSPQNVSWLSASPMGGQLAPSGSVALDVTVDPTGLSTGQYVAYLVINTNDPDQPTFVVPVTFRVNPPLPPPSIVVADPRVGAMLDVSWSASPSSGVSKYRVYRSATGGATTIFELPAADRFLHDSYLGDNVSYVTRSPP